MQVTLLLREGDRFVLIAFSSTFVLRTKRIIMDCILSYYGVHLFTYIMREVESIDFSRRLALVICWGVRRHFCELIRCTRD